MDHPELPPEDPFAEEFAVMRTQLAAIQATIRELGPQLLEEVRKCVERRRRGD